MHNEDQNILQEESIARLLSLHLRRELSASEQEKLESWIARDEWNAAYFRRATDESFLVELMSDYRKAGELGPLVKEVFQSKLITRKNEEGAERNKKGITYIMRNWMWAAVSSMLLISAVYYFWLSNNKQPQVTQSIPSLPTEIVPGGNKAVLTLGDGSTIVLDSAGNGMLAQQGNAEVVKLANGQIAYHLIGQSKGEVMMNTMKTPRGGQYQLTLPDGTKVWLNAASSITFPSIFTGKQRSVKLTGEAYFEIASNKNLPFLVTSNDMDIEVLGTSFNVNSYEDDDIHKTTLIEGSIKVIKGSTSHILKPGEQALAKENLTINKKADIQQAIAWKAGVFNFDGADLPTVMRQLARWYDIDVRYEGKGYEGKFRGKLSKSLPLEEVINILKDINLSFRIDGKTLIIQ